MLVLWCLVSLVRNRVVLAVDLLFSVVCFFTVREHYLWDYNKYCVLNRRGVMSTVI